MFLSCVCRNCVCCRVCNPELCGVAALLLLFWSCALLQLQQNFGWFRWEYFLWEFRSWDCLLSSNDLLLRFLLWGDSLCWRKWLQKANYCGHWRDSSSQRLSPEVLTAQLSLYHSCAFSLEGIAPLPVFALPSGDSVWVNNLRSPFWLPFTLLQQQQQNDGEIVSSNHWVDSGKCVGSWVCPFGVDRSGA